MHSSHQPGVDQGGGGRARDEIYRTSRSPRSAVREQQRSVIGVVPSLQPAESDRIRTGGM